MQSLAIKLKRNDTDSYLRQQAFSLISYSKSLVRIGIRPAGHCVVFFTYMVLFWRHSHAEHGTIYLSSSNAALFRGLSPVQGLFAGKSDRRTAAPTVTAYLCGKGADDVRLPAMAIEKDPLTSL